MLKVKNLVQTIFCVNIFINLCSCSQREYTKLPEPCPDTLILRDLSRQSIKDPQAEDVQARLELDAICPTCVREGNKLSIAPHPQFMAVRKNVDKTPEIKSSYFMALVDPSGKIIKKQIFILQFEFDKGKRYCYQGTKDTLSFELKTDNVKNYRVFLGLDIDEAEILKNRLRYQ